MGDGDNKSIVIEVRTKTMPVRVSLAKGEEQTPQPLEAQTVFEQYLNTLARDCTSTADQYAKTELHKYGTAAH